MTFLPEAALLGFVFFGLFSPGPNVVLLTASGARFGFGPTVPHILGVAVGVGLTAGFTGLGIGAVLTAQPALKLVLQIVASLWILWMARSLWIAKPSQRSAKDRPFTFLEAVIFQWVNPKVWAVALAASGYVVDLPAMHQAQQLALTFSGINLGVCLFWTIAGHLLSTLLRNPAAWQLFMRFMAVALVVFSVLVFL